jgi:hypothetical protein
MPLQEDTGPGAIPLEPFLSRIGSEKVLIYRDEFINAVQVGSLEYLLHYRHRIPLTDIFLESLISSVLAQSAYSAAWNAGWLVGWFMGFFEWRDRQAQSSHPPTIGREEERS